MPETLQTTAVPFALNQLCASPDCAGQNESFDHLAAEWKRETFLLSRISAKVLHLAYQKIIGMGPAAIPFILKDLQDNGPNH